MRTPFVALLTAVVVAAAPAAAEEPKFAYGKKEDQAKAPDWAASVTAGFGAATGNAQNLNFTGGGSVSRRFDENMLSFDANAAYARSTTLVALPGPGTAAVLGSTTQTSSEAWATRLRYDRFFDLNAVYAFGFAGGDIPAGKQFLGGAQVGYSRALYKTAKDELVLEAGVDYTYQRFVTGSPASVDIASVRAFLGYIGNPNDTLSYNVSVEWLGNLNEETRPTGTVGSFADNRVNGKLGLTWKIFGNGSLGFRFRALYDSAPAPKPLPPPPPGYTWQGTYLAEKLDTFTEIVLVYKLL